MVNQAYVASGIVSLAFSGLVASNLLYDRGVPSSVSRCVASALGGVAFLLAVVGLNAWTAIALSGVLALFVVSLRLGFRRGLRGARGNLPSQAWAEVTYAMAGTASLAIGWGLLGDRWLAFVPIAFMAWGDNVAGLARATLWRGKVASLWPSFAMLGVCLTAAALFQPYWVGAIGAAVATAAERYRPRIASGWGDNLNVVAASLLAMAISATVSD